MSATQTSVKEGIIRLNAGEALTDKEGYLVKMSNNGSAVPEVVLPTANTDQCLYVVENDAAEDENCDVRPLNPNRNVRIKAKGTGSAGQQVVLADVGTAADKGMVRVLPGASGTYEQIGIAEENWTDGQLLLVRPSLRSVTVS